MNSLRPVFWISHNTQNICSSLALIGIDLITLCMGFWRRKQVHTHLSLVSLLKQNWICQRQNARRIYIYKRSNHIRGKSISIFTETMCAFLCVSCQEFFSLVRHKKWLDKEYKACVELSFIINYVVFNGSSEQIS